MSNFEQTTAAHTNTGFNKRAEGALEPSGTDLLSGNAGYAGQQQRGGMNEVCDPPTIYNAAGAQAAVNYVHDDQRERTYEPLDVNKTVVQHEIERVKPVLHQEEHKTRLHEVVHHKVDAPRDLGITEVVHHGHTDPCGNALGGNVPMAGGLMTGGTTTGAGAGLLGDRSLGNTSMNTSISSDSSSDLGSERGTGAYTGTGVAPVAAAPVAATPVAATPVTDYGRQEQGVTDQGVAHKEEPHGIKGMINKVIPGAGPFK